MKQPLLTSTSTSPSVYVIYSTLMANYDCDTNLAPNLGPIYSAVTIGYPPDALSTGVCYHTNWRSINYTELYYPPPDYEVITQAACSMDYGDPRTIDSSSILAGSPIFSIPGGISRVDPLWSTCTPAAPGGYDPPRALTKAKNLIPTPTPPPVITNVKPEPSATLQLAAETGAPGTASGANIGQVPQDPSNPAGTDPQDPGASSSPGTAAGGNPGSTTGKQDGGSGSEEALGAKGDLSDPQNQGASYVPAVGSGENSGNSPQDDTGSTVPAPSVGKASGSDPQSPSKSGTSGVENGGNAGATPQDNDGTVGSPEGSKANGTDSEDPGARNVPGPASKGDPGFLPPENDGNGESDIGASLQEAPGGGLKLGTITIAPGAQTTRSGQVFSVGSNFVLVDGTSFGLQSPQSGAAPGQAYTSAPSQEYVSGGGIVVGTMTLPSGAHTTYSGHTVSVGSNIFAVDATSYVEAASGGLIIGTMTLPPGSLTTQSGHIISVGSSSVVVDGTSYTWAAGASTPTSTPATDNLGALIMSAFGTGAPANSSTSSSSPLAFTGDATRLLRSGLLTMIMVTYIMYTYIL